MGTAAIVAGLVLVVAAAGAMSPAFAAGKIFSFTIPGGEINDQLNRFAVLTGTQVLYDPKLLGHRFGKPLKGALSKEAAARQLLEGTGLTWRFIDDNVLVIEPAIPAQPKPVVVSRQIEEPPLSVTIVGARLLDQGAVSVKRRDPSRVESVTAQDMEKYPDTSLGDAMQRLTSVTMSRSHGEGYQITVRGFGPQFNNVLMDDNVMPSRNAGREFNFSDFSTDLISAVVVYKTAPPSFPSGGLGSTIDIRPSDPFDYKGRFATFSAGTTFPTPVMAATISNRFLNGRLGLLAAVSHQAFEEQENIVGMAGWKRDTAYNPGVVDDSANTTGHIYSPQNLGIGVGQFHRTRFNARVVAQYRVSDTLEVKAFVQYANLFDAWRYAGINSWFTTFDPSTASVRTDANGTVVDYYQRNALDFMASRNEARTVDESIGGTVKWTPAPDWKVELAVNAVTSKQNPGGEVEQNDTYVGYRTQARFRLGEGVRALPYIELYDSPAALNAASGGAPVTGYTDASLVRPHVIASSAENTTDRISEVRLKINRYHDTTRLGFGLSYMRRAKAVRFVDNTDVQCVFCGYPATPDLPDDLFAKTFALPNNFIPGYRNANRLPPLLIDYNPNALKAYLEAQSGISFAPTPKPSEYRVREETYAAFVEAEFDAELAGKPLHGLVGTRIESTRIMADGNDRALIGLHFVDITMEQPIYGETVPVSSASSYTYLLPSADLKWSVSDRMDVRFGLSRTMARPPIGELSPALNITVTRPGNFGALQGNPKLRPYVSTNLDFALEWPHGPNAFGSIGFFAKSVENFIVETAVIRTVNGVTDPATGTDFSGPDADDQLAEFLISEPMNGERALVWGEEFSWQRFFPQTGLGFMANLTLVNSNKRFDPADVTRTFAITGLSDSANLVTYVDRGPLNLRLSLSWRDEYLAQIGQPLDLTEPTFVNARLQADISGTYALTSSLSVYGSISNLTRSPATTHGRYSNQFLSAVSSDSRFILGLRYRR